MRRKKTLLSTCPELAEEFSDRNVGITVNDVCFRSGRTVWWKCKECSYEWQSTPLNRTQNGRISKCRRCNSFVRNFPDLLIDYNYEKNTSINLDLVQKFSGEIAMWKCHKCSFEWSAAFRDRAVGEKTCKRCNSIIVKSPDLYDDWDHTKNKENVLDISPYSHKYFWWKCKRCQKEYRAKMYVRYKNPNICYGCSSLLKVFPSVASEWSDRNKLTAFDVSWGSEQKAWWKCHYCKNEWLARISSRTSGGAGCPECDMVVLIDGTVCESLVDAYFYLNLKPKHPDLMYNKKYGDLGIKGRCRFDFFIPSENKYIEVTSFDKGFQKWFLYLRRIVKKKKYVERILGGRFEFIQKKLTRDEIKWIRGNTK